MADEKKKLNYSMVRVVCDGTIKPCEFCKEVINTKELKHEGYCAKCSRPLDKNPGDPCRYIVGYLDHRYKQQDKVHLICRFCKTITTV
jgi:hypothetical protein